MGHRSSLGNAVVFASALAVGAAGCSKDSFDPRAAAHQSGSVALVGDSLFIAETDNGAVAVVDPDAAHGARELIKTGDGPERIIARGDKVFVSNRYSRTVTQIDPSTRKIVKQIAVGAEPMGLEISPDGSQLYVANAMSQSVQAIDIESGSIRWEARLEDEIRALTVLSDGRIFAPGVKSGQMHVIDAKKGAQASVFSIVPAQHPNNPLLDRTPTAVEDVKFGLDGRIYLPHSQSTKTLVDPTPSRPAVITAYYAVPAVQGNGPAVTPGYTTVDPDVGSVVGEGPDIGVPVVAAAPSQAYAGPKSAVLDDSGSFLYSVNYLSNNVAIVPTRRVVFADPLDPRKQGEMPEVLQLVSVGRGPNGIALSDDQRKAYVYNSFDHSVSVLEAKGHEIAVTRTIEDIAPQTLTEAEQRGRVFFHDATSPSITRPDSGGVACASCHPGGREDGRTWQFAEGPRNTPSLVGKHLRATAPYHWDGAFTEFSGIEHVLQKRMGGAGLTPDQFDDILTYLDDQHAPDNPNRALDGTLTTEQQLGAELFAGKAACIACHAGPNSTDNLAWDVGTSFETIPISVLEVRPVVDGTERIAALPNTPSLQNVFSTAPYLHDGSAVSLEARVRTNPTGLHGNTAALSDTEVHALVEYLKTL